MTTLPIATRCMICVCCVRQTGCMGVGRCAYKVGNCKYVWSIVRRAVVAREWCIRLSRTHSAAMLILMLPSSASAAAIVAIATDVLTYWTCLRTGRTKQSVAGLKRWKCCAKSKNMHLHCNNAKLVKRCGKKIPHNVLLLAFSCSLIGW